MVKEPFFSILVLGRILSESKKWIMLGGSDATMHRHFTKSAFTEQEDVELTSGASVRTRNVVRVWLSHTFITLHIANKMSTYYVCWHFVSLLTYITHWTAQVLICLVPLYCWQYSTRLLCGVWRHWAWRRFPDTI